MANGHMTDGEARAELLRRGFSASEADKIVSDNKVRDVSPSRTSDFTVPTSALPAGSSGGAGSGGLGELATGFAKVLSGAFRHAAATPGTLATNAFNTSRNQGSVVKVRVANGTGEIVPEGSGIPDFLTTTKYVARVPGQSDGEVRGSRDAATADLDGLQQKAQVSGATRGALLENQLNLLPGGKTDNAINEFEANKERLQDLAFRRLEAETSFLESSQEIAEARWKDWNERYAPIERQITQDALVGRDPEFAAGKARAAVAQQFERSREAGVRRLAQSGITASSPTGQQFLRGLDVGEAATRAGESNRAREGVLGQNQDRKIGALQLGLNIPGNVAGIAGSGAKNTAASGNALLEQGNIAGSNAAGLGTAAANNIYSGLSGLAGLATKGSKDAFARGAGLESAFNDTQGGGLGILDLFQRAGQFGLGALSGNPFNALTGALGVDQRRGF